MSDGRVTNLEIGGDPGNQRGYLLATINEFGVTFKTPVCGSVDTLTGEIGCVSVGWYVVTSTGTTRGFGYVTCLLCMVLTCNIPYISVLQYFFESVVRTGQSSMDNRLKKYCMYTDALKKVYLLQHCY